MTENGLNLARLAMVIGKMHESAIHETAQLEEVFGKQRLGGASEFEIAWQICELAHSQARSVAMVNTILDICCLPERDIKPFAPHPDLDCEGQIEAWIEQLHSRCDEIGDLYGDLRERALNSPLDSLDVEMFTAELEDFLKDQP